MNRKLRGYTFENAQVRKSPKLYCTEDIPVADKIILQHYFVSGFDYYLVEYEPETTTAFGLVVSNQRYDEASLGYFNLTEMENLIVEINGSPIIVERDLHWVSCTISELESKNRSL